MIERRGFSLLECLLAAAILAMVVAACLPLISTPVRAERVRPDPDLGRIASEATPVAPPNGVIERFGSDVADGIPGSWIVIEVGDRVWLAWRPAEEGVSEGEP